MKTPQVMPIVVPIEFHRPSRQSFDIEYQMLIQHQTDENALNVEARKYQRALSGFYKNSGEGVRVEDIIVLSRGIIAHREHPELLRNLEDFLNTIENSKYKSRYDISLTLNTDKSRRVNDYQIIMPERLTSDPTPIFQYSLQDRNAIYIVAQEAHHCSRKRIQEKKKEKTPFRIPLTYILGGEKTKNGKPIYEMTIRDPSTCTTIFRQPRTRIKTVQQCRRKKPENG